MAKSCNQVHFARSQKDTVGFTTKQYIYELGSNLVTQYPETATPVEREGLIIHEKANLEEGLVVYWNIDGRIWILD